MKILILSDAFPPNNFGGAGYSAFYLACGLKRAGHQVFVITTVSDRKDEGEISYEGLKVFRIFSSYHERWRAYLSLYNPQTVGKVERLIRDIRPDVVHANNIQSNLSYQCLKIAKRWSRLVSFTARDAMLFNYGKLATEKYLKCFDCRTDWRDHLKQAKKRYNPLRNFLIRKYLSHADQIFAISNALKEALEANGIRNVKVIYNAIEASDWQENAEEVKNFKGKYGLFEKKPVLFAGRLSEPKGGKVILQAMAKTIKRMPQAVLLVLGKKDEYCQEMMNMADELGIRENIVFTGWLRGDELKSAYYSCCVAVTPSIYLDPFIRINIEAMAARKPVVGTCYGGTPEIVQDGITGYVVNPFNVELMAEKILDLLKNPGKAKQFGEAGYERVREKFSLEEQIKEYLRWSGNI